MKPVIVHDYLLQKGGAERVVDVLGETFPDAEVVTSIVSDFYRERYAGHQIRTSYLQRAPVNERTFRMLLPLFAGAFRRLTLPSAEVALCSSSGWSHLVAPTAAMPVVVYCHSPARWLWRADEYFQARRARMLRAGLAPLLSRLRALDRAAARSATAYVANSETVADRIRRIYGIEPRVVHPPVDVDRFALGREREDFYLVVSRLLDYKRIDLAVDACSQLRRRLVVVGTGPAAARLRARAGSTVEFAGWAEDEEVERLMRTCRALIFPGEEDFGITAVEAMAAGTPVVAYNGGGARETVVAGRTGVLFDRQTADDAADAIRRVEANSWDADAIRRHAMRFATSRFAEEIRAVVEEVAGATQSSVQVSSASASAGGARPLLEAR